MSNLLPVPFKSTVNFDFGEAIKQVITAEYYQPANSFQADIGKIQALRHQVYLTLNDIVTTTDGIDKLKSYYVHLSSLLLKFPSDLAEFPWYGTIGYNVTGPVKLKSITFEQINVVYNLGALFSQLAIAQSKSSEEGLKKACGYFQYAAGCFDFIIKLSIRNENLGSRIQLPLDLQLETLNMLKFLMLAQAQEMFWQKALASKLKDSVIAKLSIQVALHYNECLNFAQRSEVLRSDWLNHTKVKKFHFEAAAQYRQSIMCAANKEYGEEVARLRLALKLSKKSLSFLRYTSAAVQENANSLNKILGETLKTSEKDNDLIYLKLVAEESTLSPIQPAPMTKPLIVAELETPLKFLQSANSSISVQDKSYGKILFADLLPYFVIQIAQSFRERQENYVQQRIIDPINSLNSIIDRFLTERSLPASLDALNKSDELPKSLLLQIEEIKNLGGTATIEKSLSDISKLQSQSKNTVNGARERLEIEANEDVLLRQRYGTNFWRRENSEIAANALIEELRGLETYIAQAQQGDEVIKASYLEIKNNMEVLCTTPLDKLQKLMPADIVNDDDNGSSKDEKDFQLNDKINQLKNLINDVLMLKNNRKKFLEVVEIKSMQMNILPKVINEYKYLQSTNQLNYSIAKFDNIEEEKSGNNNSSNNATYEHFETVYETHIKGLNDELNTLDDEKSTQQKLEQKIDATFKEFELLKNQKANTRNFAKERFLIELQNLYTKYHEIIKNLNEGLAFYNDFMVSGNSLLQKIDQFIYSRRIEARDLENAINRRGSVGGGGGDSSSTGVNNGADANNVGGVGSSVISPQPKKNALGANVWDPSQGIKFG